MPFPFFLYRRLTVDSAIYITLLAILANIVSFFPFIVLTDVQLYKHCQFIFTKLMKT